MIIGLGNDIIEIDRIEKAITNSKFITKYFTEQEIELFEVRKMNSSTIAANFSLKEAVSKVFGTGIVGFSLKDIEILRTKEGKPLINLYGNAKKKADIMGINRWHATVSHNKSIVSVVVIGENDDCSQK